MVDSSLAETIANKGVNLKTLVAEFCKDFSCDKTLNTLSAGKCEKITKIVMGNGSVTDKGIEDLAHAPFKDELKSIDLRRNMDVSQTGYDQLNTDFKLDEIDGMLLSQIPESEVGGYFMMKRSMMGES